MLLMLLRKTILLCSIALLFAGSAAALITGGYGNEPVTERNWRTNAIHVANLKCRVGFWEGPPFGGGQYHFLYRADTATFIDALLLFSEIRSPKLELHIHDGPHEDFWLQMASNEKLAKPRDPRVDFTFTIWDAHSFHQLNSNPNSTFGSNGPDFHQPLPAPRIDLYIGGGLIDFAGVKVPPNVQLIDHRASALGIDTTDGPAIVGSVYDLATSKVLAGATVTVIPRSPDGKPGKPLSATADAEGRFRLEKLPTDPVTITASAPGYAPRVVAYDQLSAHDGRTFDVELAPAATVSGTVLKPDGKPLEGAEIVVYDPMAIDGRGYRAPESPRVKTDAAGHFELTSLPTGFAQISFFAKGYHANWDPSSHPTPDKAMVLRSTSTGTVKGKVLRPDGTPSKDAQVHIEPEGGSKIGSWGGSTNLQPDGTYKFEDVPVGRYVLSTKPFLPGVPRDADTQTIEIKPGPATEVNFKVK